KQGGCSSLFTINGSTPSGGNGSFRYLWYAKGNNSGWEELLNEKSKDITQKSYNNAKYFVRVVKSGNCITSSNEVNINTVSNENSILNSYSGNDTCASLLFGSNINFRTQRDTFQ